MSHAAAGWGASWPTTAEALRRVQRELALSQVPTWQPPGRVAAAYHPGLLALREGPMLEAAVAALPRAPDVLVVNATGRDHPRRAGLALQLGAVVGVPTVGVTHRPMLAAGEWPPEDRGASARLAPWHTARGPAARGAGPHIAVKADATGVTEDVGHSGLPLQVSAFKHRSPPADLRSPSIPWVRGYGQNGAGTSGSDAQWPGNPPVHGQNRLV